MVKIIALEDVFQEKAVEASITRGVKEHSEKLSAELIEHIEKFYKDNSLTYETIGLVLLQVANECELRFLETIAGLTRVIQKQTREDTIDKSN